MGGKNDDSDVQLVVKSCTHNKEAQAAGVPWWEQQPDWVE